MDSAEFERAVGDAKKVIENNANHYLLIYWLLFIYLSLQSLDECIELFSVLMQLEKGALGLFFEMNYLVGVILCIYNMWFILTVDYPVLEGYERDSDGSFGEDVVSRWDLTE